MQLKRIFIAACLR